MRSARPRPAAASSTGPGISIKLSALHPRYARAQVARVMAELAPRVTRLALLARQYDIGLNIDAEEADRLELSLDLLERLCFEPELAGWNGIGFVIQAYQKRCPAVVDLLIDLARRSGHRLMVRLVKGAYWDSEIKRAQVDGQDGYPVYTRKAYTDVAYIACARKLLAAPDAVFPQFATHNAHTLAAIHTLAGPDWHAGQYEFQCLHGMGEPLYEQVVGAGADSARQAGRAASTRRWARTRRCWPIWCAGCWKTAPTPRSSTASPTRTSRSKNWSRTRCAPSKPWPRARARSACLTRRSPCRASCSAAGTRANSRGLDLADERTLAALDRAFADASAKAWRAEPCWPAANPQGRLAAGAQPRRPRRHGGRGARGHARRRAGGLDRRHAGRLGLGRDAAGRTRGAARSRCRHAGGRHRWRCCRCWCAKPARPAPMRWPRCARRWTSCATTPPRCGAISTTAPTAARPGGVHQPVEFPAGHLHRPGRRRTRGRQRGAGQARRADAADGRRGRARAACGRRAAGRAAAAARARRNGRRRAGGRRARARRALHRLHRGGAPAAAHAGRPPDGARASPCR